MVIGGIREIEQSPLGDRARLRGGAGEAGAGEEEASPGELRQREGDGLTNGHGAEKVALGILMLASLQARSTTADAGAGQPARELTAASLVDQAGLLEVGQGLIGPALGEQSVALADERGGDARVGPAEHLGLDPQRAGIVALRLGDGAVPISDESEVVQQHGVLSDQAGALDAGELEAELEERLGAGEVTPVDGDDPEPAERLGQPVMGGAAGLLAEL